jgi:hypothetical protein
MSPSDPSSIAPLSGFRVSSRNKPRASAPSQCGSDADAVGAEAAALAALSALSASCTNASGLVNQNPLGRYGDSGSCSFDCGFKEQKWSWWADYRPTNTNLLQVVAVCNITAPYTTVFQPTQTWVNTDLPAFGSSLNGNLTTIAQIDAAIVAAHGVETPQQAAQLAAAFSTLASILQNNLSEANRALQNLASYLSSVQSWSGTYLPNYVTSARAYIQTSATKIEEDLIGQIACGADDVRNSFNGMFADVNAKFANMQPGFNDVTAKLTAAVQAGQHVAGVFLVVQSDSTLVSQQLTKAQSYNPISPLRTMHLNMAGNEWSGLVQEANFQLKPGSGGPVAQAQTESIRGPARASSLTFRMPREMALPGICRGALTYWPQLKAALAELRQDPAFHLAVPQDNLVGSPAQILAALATDPGSLLRSTPPADLYAWFLWLTLRVHQAAQAFHLTLRGLPDLFKPAQPADPVAEGALVKEVLMGPTSLIQRAANLTELSNIFAQHLREIEGALKSTQATQETAAAALAEETNGPGPDKPEAGIANLMLAYSRACTATSHADDDRARLRGSAAKVTASAVISNMASAVESLSGAWQATATQFEAIAAVEPAQLGNEDFLRNELELETAAREWGIFAGVTRKFIQGLLLK